MGKEIIGLIVPVTIIGRNKKKKLKAKIDTGADKSSIDKSLASQLGLGPVIKIRGVRSASGRTVRPVVRANVKINHKELKTHFNIAERGYMKYKVLIGKNTLRKLKVLIDPNKKEVG